MDFDIIPYEDIVWGARLGGGSFGSVYKGTYLDIDIAIKEVLPSTEYDVHKYFEREWRIMRECRHPNIVLFLGLSKAPEEDGRVFIISEYVPRGNLRQFILSTRSFPWRLRLSFATDVARAVAYLHARLCIHRDLKGENLLITSNDRIKVTDFGFARIASRNAEEMRRMTYCGTDGYMSPEIINGLDFDLPTDVFSLGIIFIEIMSRRLVDSKTYIRLAPSFTPDPSEVRRRASPGCPPALIDLALSCCLEAPSDRPLMQTVLTKLRAIELEVMSRLPEEGSEHVGSIRLVNHSGKRAMPSFEPPPKDKEAELEAEEADAKMEEDALVALAGLNIDGSGPSDASGKQTWRTPQWIENVSAMSQYTLASEMRGHHQRLLPSSDTSSSLESKNTDSSAGSSIPSRPIQQASALNDAKPPDDDPASSVMTVRQCTPPDSAITLLDEPTTATSDPEPETQAVPETATVPPTPLPPQSQIETIPSLPSSHINPSLEAQPVTEAGTMEDSAPNSSDDASAEQSAPVEVAKIPRKFDQARKEEQEAEEAVTPTGLGTHRFTLVDKDAIPLINGKKVSGFSSAFAFAFLPKSLSSTSRCPVCQKRLGQRPALQCDDCHILVHVKCSHAAPRNCEISIEQS